MDDPLRISLGCLIEGSVVDRPNRFVAVVRVGEEEVLAHVADSGRLKELIYPGNRVMVRKIGKPALGEPGVGVTSDRSRPRRGATPRKTAFDLVLAAAPALHGTTSPSAGTTPLGSRAALSDGAMAALSGATTAASDRGPRRATSATNPTWVSVDTRYPTRLFGQALRAGTVPEFRDYDVVRPEYPFHRVEDAQARQAQSQTPRSRLDFYVEGTGVPPALIEVKSVTLCVDGIGLFPDAPTDRGARHLGELQKAVGMGYRAYAVFIAQREDIMVVSPNSETDPKFAEALRQARAHGVSLLAYGCRVTPESIVLDPVAMPVVLPE